jgi:hypothetical protein
MCKVKLGTSLDMLINEVLPLFGHAYQTTNALSLILSPEYSIRKSWQESALFRHGNGFIVRCQHPTAKAFLNAVRRQATYFTWLTFCTERQCRFRPSLRVMRREP